MPTSRIHTHHHGVIQAKVACTLCRKRKVKCDRELPRCQPCTTSQQQCSYPQHIQKPGPKLGTLQKKRRRTLSQRSEDKLDGMYKHSNDDTNSGDEDDEENEVDHDIAASPVSTRFGSRPADMHAISFIVHPCHESCPPETPISRIPTANIGINEEPALTSASFALGVAPEIIKKLLRIFVETFTSFRLFREPFSLLELQEASNGTQINALIAAMLAFARKSTPSRNADPDFQQPCHQFSEEYFVDLATSFVHQAIIECGDERPSLCLLQAMILLTHRLLCKGVRGRAWRSLGLCIRVAYELNLHLLDHGYTMDTIHADAEHWVKMEEKRRAWWAIWEMDVFASVLRRCPTAIDWAHNEVFLPAEDKLWFEGTPQTTCFLERGFLARSKVLEKTGTQSAKAWFIVINSLMKEAQSITSSCSMDSGKGNDDGSRHSEDQVREAVKKLQTLENSLHYCTTILPQILKYHGQFLDFGDRIRHVMAGNGTSIRHLHSSIFGIHLMTELTELMIHKYQVFQPQPFWNGQQRYTNRSPSSDRVERATEHYFTASDSILGIINNCSKMHHRYVNPFLSSTIWLATAVQLVRLQIVSETVERDLIVSNFEILNMIHSQFVSYWGMSDMPQKNLSTLAERLNSAFITPPNDDKESNIGSSHNQLHSIKQNNLPIEAHTISSNQVFQPKTIARSADQKNDSLRTSKLEANKVGKDCGSKNDVEIATDIYHLFQEKKVVWGTPNDVNSEQAPCPIDTTAEVSSENERMPTIQMLDQHQPLWSHNASVSSMFNTRQDQVYNSIDRLEVRGPCDDNPYMELSTFMDNLFTDSYYGF